MDWTRQCAAVIPCFNEAAGIGEVVAGVRRFLPSVIVVDDGSTDDTAARANAAGAVVVHHSTNRGKGTALQTGWQHAREKDFVWALTMDGDGQHSPEDVSGFFACAEKSGASLIIGNRMNHPEAMPWLRQQVNRWMSRRLSNFTGAPLADSQCGFRLVNLDALSRLQLAASRFEIESEMLVAFVAAGHKVEFVPIRVIYKSNSSKIHPLMDTWRWFRWWFGQRKGQQ
jgi:glycosyltransferase involved in cell wall biosynthesis